MPATARALTRSVLEAGDLVARHPADAAAVYSTYGGKGPLDDLAAMLASHTHHNHPIGTALKQLGRKTRRRQRWAWQIEQPGDRHRRVEHTRKHAELVESHGALSPEVLDLRGELLEPAQYQSDFGPLRLLFHLFLRFSLQLQQPLPRPPDPLLPRSRARLLPSTKQAFG